MPRPWIIFEVTLKVTDVNGNSSEETAIVAVTDQRDPEAQCKSSTVSVHLDANGKADITYDMINASSYDNCTDLSDLTYELSQSTFNCYDRGNVMVTLTVTDESGNSAQCTTNVEILDSQDPTAVCKDATIYLDRFGDATLMPMDVDGGSGDNCTIAWMSVLPKSAFDYEDVGTHDITLTVEDSTGNTGQCYADVTVLDTISPIVHVYNKTFPLNQNGTVTIDFDDVEVSPPTDACGIKMKDLSRTDFSCADVGEQKVTYTVEDNNGNKTNRVITVTIEDNYGPEVNCTAKTIYLDDQGMASIMLDDILVSSGDPCGIQSHSLSQTEFTCMNLGINTIYLTATDNNGNATVCTTTVEVIDNIPPNLVCKNISVFLNGSGSASITADDIDNGSTDNCSFSLSIDRSTFDCDDAGKTIPVVLTMTDAGDNSVTCTANVTVLDSIKPTPVLQNIIVELNSQGKAEIDADQFDNGSTDNCGTVTFTASKTKFDCDDLGSNNINVTITDSHRNKVVQSAKVTVKDKIRPVARTKNITVTMGKNGQVKIDPEDLNNLSTDNCGIESYEASKTTFNCTKLGENTVQFTVEDNAGNTDTEPVIVTVLENIVPEAVCANISISLDDDGMAAIDPIDVDGGSAYPCSITSRELNRSTFDCNDTGNPVQVELTVIYSDNTSDQCIADVTVLDEIEPIALCKDTILYLNASGVTSIEDEDLDKGSSDNCGTVLFSAARTTFTSADLGIHSVTLTVSDPSGNSSNCNANVTVLDTLKPEAICKNLTVYLDAGGQASIAPSDLNDGSSDNGGIVSFSASKINFDCADLGEQDVILTVTDPSANFSQCTATVTVVDTVSPTVSVKNITINLSASGSATILASDLDNGSTDACGIFSVVASSTEFDCENLGENEVVLTVTDIRGNSSHTVAIVTVVDVTPPVAQIKPVTIYLDESGQAVLNPDNLDNGSGDICGEVTFDASQTIFNCQDLGENVITFEVEDVSGNKTSIPATVTVAELNTPMAICQNITVYLDDVGMATIQPIDVDGGSTNSCSIDSRQLSRTSFNCNDLGEAIPVILTVDYRNADDQVCTAYVTVIDEKPPAIASRDFTVYLDGSGEATLIPDSLDDGSSDNCGTIIFQASKTTYSCEDLGENKVDFTVKDGSGNSLFHEVSVYVKDTFPPIIVCRDYEIFLDSSGNASIDIADVEVESNDNCPITKALSVSAFDCDDVNKTIPVILTATDASDNFSRCTSQVTIRDVIMPIARSTDIIVYLDANGIAHITPDDIDDGSWDNCTLSKSIDITTFDCNDLGDNTVTLTVKDAAGNQDISQATVKVVDEVSPLVTCKDLNVYLDGDGRASITVDSILVQSSDACGIESYRLSRSEFTCIDMGAIEVTLTAMDSRGNTGEGISMITVLDTTPPNAISKKLTVFLDDSGNGTLLPRDLDGGSLRTGPKYRYSFFESWYVFAAVERV